MKSDILFSWVFGLIVLGTLLLTLHEFVHFKIRQHLKKSLKPKPHPIEGKYFELFVPHPLKEKYKVLLEEYFSSLRPQNTRALKVTSVVFASIFAVMVVTFINSQSYKLYKAVDLDPDEVKNLDITPRQFVGATDYDRLPAGSKPASANIKYTLLTDRNSPNSMAFVAENIPGVVVARTCHWDNVEYCMRTPLKDVFLVPPGKWNEPVILKLLNSGYALHFYGYPTQIVATNFPQGGSYKFLDLEFVRFSHLKEKDFSWRAAADQRLTLGLPAAQIFPEAQPDKNLFLYKVKGPAGEAFTASARDPLFTSDEVRLFSGVQGEGRWVWQNVRLTTAANDSEEIRKAKSVLGSNIQNFLSRKSYSSVAHWPEAARFAAHFEQDTEDQFKNSKKVLSVFKKHEVPVTWYVLSEEAEKNRSLVAKLAEFGEVGCHGDNHDVFPDGSLFRQVYRISKCKKTLQKLTDRVPAGFRPPEEKFNTDTLSAAANSGIEYLFTLFDGISAAPRMLMTGNEGKKMVLFPRLSHDDYLLWALKNSPVEQSVAIVKNDVDWLEKLGGLYTFSFHTQFMSDADSLTVLDQLLGYTKSRKPYFATGKDLADWWRYRDELLQDSQYVDDGAKAKFRPYLLTVSENGDLVSKPL